MNDFLFHKTKREGSVMLIFTDKNNKECVGCVCTFAQ